MCKERASDESGGFEDDPERIRQELLPGPAPPDDPATALQTIDDWNETWVSICDTQDTNRIVLSKELASSGDTIINSDAPHRGPGRPPGRPPGRHPQRGQSWLPGLPRPGSMS